MQAVYCYADKNIDFIDAFNAAWMLAQGLTVAVTFDRKHFSRLEGVGFQVPGE